MKLEYLKGLRECCHNDAAFERMQQILLVAEAEKRQFDLTELFEILNQQWGDRPVFAPDLAHSQGTLEQLILERTTNLLNSNRRLLQEVVEREWVEKALQESEQRFRSLIENGMDVIVILDAGGTVSYCSPSVERLLGYPPPLLSRRSLLELVHPADRALLQQVLQDVCDCSRISHPVEYRIQHQNGNWQVFEAIATNLLDDPAIQGIVVNGHDITQRSQAEAALQSASQRILNLLESVTDAFISLDHEWRFTYVNQQAAHLFQRSPIELLGNCIWQVLPDLAGSPFEFESQRAFDHQIPITFESFYATLSTWFEVRVFPSTDGLSIFMLDISDRKQSQAELLEMSTALGNAVEGIARLDLNNHFIALNRAFAASLGYQQEEMIGLPWGQVFHPDDAWRVEQAYQQMLTEGKAEVEVRAQRQDGSSFYVQMVTVAAFDWNDHLVGHHCFTKDITERKQAAAALHQREEQLRLTLEATQVGCWRYDLRTQRILWSESCERLFGLAPGTFGGTYAAFLDCVHPEDRPWVEREVQQSLSTASTEKDSTKEFRILWQDGSVRWISDRCHTCHDPSGQPIMVLGTSLDITDRKRSEEWLHYQTERERLVGAIAHRIRLSLHLGDILNTTVREVQKFLRAERVLICRCGANQSGVVIAESVQPDYPSMLHLELRHLWIQEMGIDDRSGRNLVIDDVGQFCRFPGFQAFARQWQIAAILAVPILNADCLWGVLVMHQCSTPRQWDALEVALLEQLATQVAIAIQQAELYHRVQQLNGELEQQVQERTAQLQQALQFEALLKRITDAVRDSLDEDQILQTAVQELALGLELKGCDAALHDQNQQTATIRYEFVREDLTPIQGRVLSLSKGTGIYEHLLRGQWVQFCRITSDSPRPELTRTAILACPISDDQEVLGNIWLFKSCEEAFSELEIRLVQQVANQCAIALRQARLYQASQAQVAALEALNQLKDDFLSTVSHELRTPMSNMKMAIHMLKTVTDPERQTRYLDILQTECLREIELINDLLDLQRLEADSYRLSPEPLDLQSCLRNLVDPFYTRASDRRQAFSLNLPSDLPTLITDQTVLERILAELLNNACKYTPPESAICLHACVSPQSEEITIQVSNQAEIPPSEIPRVFDKFYRIPNGDRWKQGGTGLGLALVKKLVDQLNGTIHLTSADGWTTFTISLKTAL